MGHLDYTIKKSEERYKTIRETNKRDLKMARLEGITDEHLEFLDELKETGETNMFGVRPYLIREFGIEKNEAAKILTYWMNTFGQDDR